MSRILIDAGKSEQGWSYWGDAFHCLRLFAYRQRLNMAQPNPDAPTRGAMGHVMQAHHHARFGARQRGGCYVGTADGVVHVTDPDQLYEPEEAVELWCQKNPHGEQFIGRMKETYRNYVERYPESPGKIMWVEVSVKGLLGLKDGSFGLWVDDGTVEPELVDGKPVAITRRLDLVLELGGLTFVWDHKHQASVQPGRSKDAYAMDGGMASQRILAGQVFGRHAGTGDFRGLTLNLVQTQSPWKVHRVTPRPTPYRDAQFPELLRERAHAIARNDMERDPWLWPPVQHEMGGCYHRYGRCDGFELCSFGPRALDVYDI